MTARLVSQHQLSKRNPDDFPEELKFALDQITINEVPRVVGSSAYRIHRYPSDVDVFEKVTYTPEQEAEQDQAEQEAEQDQAEQDKEVEKDQEEEVEQAEEAQDFYADQFQNMAQRLLIQRKHLHFADFKAGMDERFNVDLAEDLTTEQAQELTVQLGNQHDLPEGLCVELFQLTVDPSAFKERLSELKTVRWTLEEMIKGQKMLVGGVCLSLAEAIGMNTVVKIDTIVWFSGRFQAVEVFFNLQYQDETGAIREFHPLNNYVQGLTEDIEKYSGEKNYNPLKVLKRMWSLSRVIQCQDLLEAISPILGSDAAALNQINSDLEMLEILLEDTDLCKKELKRAFVEALTFHKRATNHLGSDQLMDYHQLIDPIFDLYVDWQTGASRDQVMAQLKACLATARAFLKPIIVQLSQGFLENLKAMNITCQNPQFRPSEDLMVTSPYSAV